MPDSYEEKIHAPQTPANKFAGPARHPDYPRAGGAMAECEQPGNLVAVKRGWENLHFRTETEASEPERF